MKRRDMITINGFLDRVLDDFKDYVDTQEQLCDLLDVHFDGGRVPDYSDIHVQQLYLLRYAYAYAFEYKYMYSDLLSRINLGQKIEVTSVGCGNRIDYWSLAHVVKQKCDICYKGIDTIDWSYRFAPRSRDDVRHRIGDAVSLFQGAHGFSSDIYIFPKSISEFSPDEVHVLADCFTKENISKDVIHFMFSLRTDSGSIERDTNKTNIFYERLLECGFRTNDDSNFHAEFYDSIKGKSIREIDNDFHHPGDVIDYLKELYEKCTDFHDCFRSESEDCKSRLGRWPILKCRQAAWQIFTFER